VSELSVTAVIVNYNAGDLLLPCIRSLRDDGVADVVVVDNGSSDGSLDALGAAEPAVKVVPLGRNLGYGSAVNRGAHDVTADCLLIMNPDTLVEPGMVKALVAALERGPRVGIAGPRIEEPDGSLYPSARTFPSLADAIGHAFLGLIVPSNPFTRRYRMLDWDHATARDVDWLSGACLLVRRRAFEEIGGFDEAYFMYLEDVDLCWRMQRAGWGVTYEPSARLVHFQGHSTSKRPYRMLLEHHRALLRWWQRTTAGPRRLLLPLVAVGLVARLLLAFGQHAAEGRIQRRREGGTAPTSD
jgi:N-acetylglucosaminyl-diphospho-decaprenol L-rhamnosyltransferase